MKRLIVTLVAIITALILFSASVSAQNLTGGVKAGLNISNIYGEHYDIPEEGTDCKIGFCAGAFFAYYFNDIFSIQPEVLFTMKGMKWQSEHETQGIPVECNRKWNMNYLEIPVLAKLSITTKGSVKPNLFIGPYLGLKLSAKYWFECEGASGGASIREWGEGDIKDINSTDLGLVIGGGFDFALSQGKLGIDVRYTMGLTRIRDYEGTSEKHGVISLMLGYSFWP